MKSKISKIILIFAIVVIQILSISTVSKATTDSRISIEELKNNGSSQIKQKVGIGALGSSEYLYCIDYGAHKNPDPINIDTYQVKKYIEIDGKNAKIYDENNNSKEISHDTNAIVAYILGGGSTEKFPKGCRPKDSFEYYKRQWALWRVWNNWCKDISIDECVGSNNYKDVIDKTTGSTNNEFYYSYEYNKQTEYGGEAVNYAKNLKTEESEITAKVVSNTGNVIISEIAEDNSQWIGPINLKFSGELSLDNSAGLEFYDSDKNKLEGIKDIKSDEDFFIKNNTKTEISNLKFKATATNPETIKAKIWIMEYSENGSSQKLIITDANPKENKSEATLDLKVEKVKKVNIQGYVWIEKPGSKANEYNDMYDNGEEIITNNVKITLRDKGSNAVIAENPIIKTENGKAMYRFEKINFNKLKDCYVHFDYSEKYKNHITVSAIFDAAEGSKAISDNVPEADKDLTGIATTYKGTADEAKYGLSYLATKFFNESTSTLENVNLGIKELPETPFTVSENLAYVDMKIKGYNYRYIYGGTGPKVQTVPTVQWQSKTDKECYTRDIYPSDILYENPSDKTQELQVYVTYRIDVTNNTNIDIPYLYQEKSLNVTRVLNKFDTKRYELADDNWEQTDSADVVKMKSEYVQKQYYDANKNGILNENDKNNKYAYIKFKIRDEELKKLLQSKFGTIEDFPTAATVTAYHKYTRIDYSWNNNLTKTQDHKTDERSMEDSAPYLNLRCGENRKISGKVFEDKNLKDNGELVGNGIYDNNEDKVKNVTVELGNYNGKEFKTTYLYQVNEEGYSSVVDKTTGKTIKVNDSNRAEISEGITQGKYDLPKASVKTSDDGTYTFDGVIPGEYFLRFTYGDGTQEIVNPNGNKKVSSDLYKSTIVTDEIRNVFETKYEATKATWYLGINENHNLALDDLAQRQELSKNRYELDIANIQNVESKNITAQTPEFSVPIEFKDKSEGSTTEQYPKELGYMDFGIIEIPNTRIGINKKITNIKLTYQNGQVAIDGNPATQNLAYTTDLDKKTNGGSKYVKVELDSEYIYGGKLEIRYDIEITNNSDLDYIEEEGSDKFGYYYKYGIKDFAHEKQVNIKEAFDYLDPKLSYKSKDGELDIKEIDIKQFKNKDNDKLQAEEKNILNLVKEQESASGKQFEKIYQINGIGNLYSSKGSNKDKSSKTVTINANKILSSQEDDLEFINVAEVTKIEVEKMTPARVVFGVSVANANTSQTIAKTEDVKITVTPSTGADRSLVYVITGIISISVLASGIVIIKKKVL